jgi:hypothetical protein
MLTHLRSFANNPIGGIIVLLTAAYLEAQGDACFQSGFYNASGPRRIQWLLLGTVALIAYSSFLNSSKVEFNKVLGIYIVCFLLVGQFLAKVQLGNSPGKPIYVGGAFIVVGGFIMRYWKG